MSLNELYQVEGGKSRKSSGFSEGEKSRNCSGLDGDKSRNCSGNSISQVFNICYILSKGVLCIIYICTYLAYI